MSWPCLYNDPLCSSWIIDHRVPSELLIVHLAQYTVQGAIITYHTGILVTLPLGGVLEVVLNIAKILVLY